MAERDGRSRKRSGGTASITGQRPKNLIVTLGGAGRSKERFKKEHKKNPGEMFKKVKGRTRQAQMLQY